MPKINTRIWDDTPIPNTYNVPKRQWRKWVGKQQKLFNALYELGLDQKLFTHPKALRQDKKIWETTAWNFAWMAADLS